jgi:hypothetical protein
MTARGAYYAKGGKRRATTGFGAVVMRLIEQKAFCNQ